MQHVPAGGGVGGGLLSATVHCSRASHDQGGPPRQSSAPPSGRRRDARALMRSTAPFPGRASDVGASDVVLSSPGTKERGSAGERVCSDLARCREDASSTTRDQASSLTGARTTVALPGSAHTPNIHTHRQGHQSLRDGQLS